MKDLIKRIQLLDPELASEVEAEFRRAGLPDRPEDIEMGSEVGSFGLMTTMHLSTGWGTWTVCMSGEGLRLSRPGHGDRTWVNASEFFEGHAGEGRSTWGDILAWEASHVDGGLQVPVVRVERAVSSGDVVYPKEWSMPEPARYEPAERFDVSLVSPEDEDLGVWHAANWNTGRSAIEVIRMVWPYTVNPLRPPTHISPVRLAANLGEVEPGPFFERSWDPPLQMDGSEPPLDMEFPYMRPGDRETVERLRHQMGEMVAERLRHHGPYSFSFEIRDAEGGEDEGE